MEMSKEGCCQGIFSLSLDSLQRSLTADTVAFLGGKARWFYWATNHSHSDRNLTYYWYWDYGQVMLLTTA